MLDPKDRTKLLYSRLAPFYSALRSRNGTSRLIKNLDIHPRHSILDCGTGPGLCALRISRRFSGSKVYGIDFCEQFVSIARKKAARKKLGNVFFGIGDLEKLAVNDEVFDRLICVQVLQLIPDQIKVVSELVRVLKPGGKAVFAEPLDGWHFWKEFAYLFWNAGVKTLSIRYPELRSLNRNDYAGKYFTSASLWNVLLAGGFEEVRIRQRRALILAVCTKSVSRKKDKLPFL